MAAVWAWLLGGLASAGAALLWIPRELWKRWRGRLTDSLDAAVARRVNLFHRRYREHVLAGLRYIDVHGLPTVGFHTPELADVFVDVGLDYSAPHQVPESVLAGISGDRHSLADFLDRDERMILAVVGAPGGGKTTLLRHTARQAFGRRTVPILLYLRDHAARIVTEPAVRLPDLLRGTLGALADDEPSGWLEHRLRGGSCVVLLDGLDEVATDRRAVVTWVEHQTTQYPKSDFVITSRPRGYRETPVNGAVVLRIRGLTGDQVTGFVRSWYEAAARHKPIEHGAEDLLKRLADTPVLADLAANPLLLTMIANVHLHRGALPGSRVDLYREICEVTLWRRQEAKRLSHEGEQTEKLLRELAFTMTTRKTRDLPRAELPVGLADISANGLFIEREAGVYAFAHLTFQEYLAAVHIRDTGDVETLIESLDDSWWRETLLLYAALTTADPIVEACLQSGTVNALALAFDIADEGRITPDMARRLEILLESLGDDPARAGILITRFFRRGQVQTEAGGRICPRPVPAEIYEIFLATKGIPPNTGVWAGDAEAFVRWANEVTDADYRLPTHAELADPAVQRVLGGETSVWAQGPALWTPAGATPPNEVHLQDLADHLDQDLARSASYLAALTVWRKGQDLRAFVTYLARLTHFYRDLDDRRRLALTVLGEISEGVKLIREPPVDAGAVADMTHQLRRTIEKAEASSQARRAASRFGPDVASGAMAARLRKIIRPVDELVQLLGSVLDANRAWTLAHEPTLAHALALDLRVTDSASVAPLAPLTENHHADWLWARVLYVGTSSALVSLDALAEVVRTAHEQLSDPTERTRTMAGRLAEMVLPIATRERAIDPVTASAARIAALCLAAETKLDSYSRIAAGVTLLERRVTGQSPATETIVLATS
jgi:NACHT domain